MTEEMTRGEKPGAKKQLVLGFDAGCFACSDLAARIEERVGGAKLTVRSLTDPEVQGWRERALGPAAPWAPTLFEVEGNNVRAWVGWKMGLVLSRALGPLTTWHVVQILGELREEAGIDESEIVEPAPDGGLEVVSGGMNRGQFLKALSGAALAMSVMSGTGGLASSAAAASRRPSPYDVIRMKTVTGDLAARMVARAKASKDARYTAGSALQNITARPAVVRMTLRNGTVADTVVFETGYGKQFLGVGLTSKSVAGRARSYANLWRVEHRLWSKPRGRWALYKASEGQRPIVSAVEDRASLEDPLLAEGRAVSGKGCPPVGSTTPSGGAYCETRKCVEKNPNCDFIAGAGTAACWGATVASALSTPITGPFGVVGAYTGIVGCSAGTYLALQDDTCCVKWKVCRVPC